MVTGIALGQSGRGPYSVITAIDGLFLWIQHKLPNQKFVAHAGENLVLVVNGHAKREFVRAEGVDMANFGKIKEDAVRNHAACTVCVVVFGGGTRSPCSRNDSMCKFTASAINCCTSSTLSPVATHPGKSGRYAE